MTERYAILSLDRTLAVIISECKQYVDNPVDGEILDDSLKNDLNMALHYLKSAKDKVNKKL